jgi:Family of unknown function (DUF5335)
MTHETQELPREDWRTYFDDLSRRLGAVDATVEIDAGDLGAQVEAERLVLTGISYDDRDDVLVINLAEPGAARDELERMVQQPQRILVDSAAGVLPTTIEVEDAEGQRTLVELRAAPELPAE